MNEAELHRIAIKLELKVKDSPYMFVPETGPFAGMLGLNYANIVRAVLELVEKKEKE